MEICYLTGAHKLAHLIHDSTIPRPPHGEADQRYDEEV